ncbi:MAG: hypothetical protein ACREM8_02865 [Vulcanimicrobiaceae bacterium]
MAGLPPVSGPSGALQAAPAGQQLTSTSDGASASQLQNQSQDVLTQTQGAIDAGHAQSSMALGDLATTTSNKFLQSLNDNAKAGAQRI